jgi:hypothetical protein
LTTLVASIHDAAAPREERASKVPHPKRDDRTRKRDNPRPHPPRASDADSKTAPAARDEKRAGQTEKSQNEKTAGRRERDV